VTGQGRDYGEKPGGERLPHTRLEPVIGELPADFTIIQEEARGEGYRFVDRLANEWVSGAIRFSRAGEMLLAAYVGTALAGIGGVTVDPVVPDALRMRRFYVRTPFRKRGIGRKLAEILLERAFHTVSVVTVNAGPGSNPFWERLGFIPDIRDGHTHALRLLQPPA
jgi:GNAT superfamily N-acetyltransferase